MEIGDVTWGRDGHNRGNKFLDMSSVKERLQHDSFMKIQLFLFSYYPPLFVPLAYLISLPLFFNFRVYLSIKMEYEEVIDQE